MCNGIYFLWQNYLLQNEGLRQLPVAAARVEADTSLVLLSEADQLGLLPVAAAVPAAAESPQAGMADDAGVSQSAEDASIASGELAVASQQQQMCLLVGPFKEEVSGRQMIGRLAALDILARLQTIEIPGKPDYWVHLPPQLSRRAAIKLLRELQAKSVDSYLITEGELENGISLGFFTDQSRADKVYSQRIKEGYQAEIKTVPRIYTEIWVLLAPAEADKFSEPLWEKISEGDRQLERRKNYCDKIASTDNFD
jgi:hypothetical protein